MTLSLLDRPVTLSLLLAVAAGFVLLSCALALVVGAAIRRWPPGEPEEFDYFDEPDPVDDTELREYAEALWASADYERWRESALKIVAGPGVDAGPTLPLGGGDSSPAMSDEAFSPWTVVDPDGRLRMFGSTAAFVTWVRQTYVEAGQ